LYTLYLSRQKIRKACATLADKPPLEDFVAAGAFGSGFRPHRTRIGARHDAAPELVAAQLLACPPPNGPVV